MRLRRLLPVAIACLATASSARAEDGWATRFPAVKAALADGAPLVVHVIVPLCHEDQVRCGGGRAGKPRDLERNLYWGAIFGARRFLDRPRSAFERVSVEASPEADVLERVTYRRRVDGAAFGLAGRKVEQLVVLDAFAGDAIDAAVTRFATEATRPSTLRIARAEDAKASDAKPVATSAVVYAGHNRMMDGFVPKLEGAAAGAKGAPASIVLACETEPYFGPLLRGAGGVPLLTTRALMAPEGYLVDSVAMALGDGATEAALRERVIASGMTWWKLDRAQVGWIFAPFQAPGAPG